MSEGGPSSVIDAIGVSARASRVGPRLALAGLIAWFLTISLYLWFAPPRPMPGTTLDREATRSLIIAVVLGAFGTFAASTLSAIGMILCLAERTHRPGRRASLGLAGGIAGCAILLLVIVEILRRVKAG